MKILVIHWGRSGGGVRFAYEAARHLAERPELEVHVSYSKNSEISSWFSGIGIGEFPVWTLSSKLSFLKVLARLPLEAVRVHRYCKDHEIDLIFSPMEQVFQSLIAPVFRLGGRKYVLGIHDGNFHLGEESFLREVLRALDLRMASSYLVFSKKVGLILRERMSASPKSILEILHPSVASNNVEMRVPPASGPAVLGFFGRILPYKGLHVLLQAGQILHERGRNVVIRVHGDGSTPESEVLMDSPIVQDRRGWVPEKDIEGIIDDFDLLILPYTEASQSGVLAIAASRGVPVVATPVGGLEEQVVASGSGEVALGVSPEAIANTVERILDSPVLYSEYSRTGIASAKGSMSWSSAAAILSAEFSKL